MAALPWSGRADAVARAESLRRLVPLIAIIRDEGGGRVRPAGGGRSRISYRLGVHDAATARRALVEMARLARAGNAAGIRAVATPGRGWRDGEGFDAFLAELDAIDTGPNRLSLFSAHQMGSARAGADPRSSATDPWGRVRADRGGSLLRGAYVADGSLLPTAPGVNPMLTIMAFAERVARAIISDRA
jgi:choline dehydrogenase-like flavoprotein